MYMPTSIFVPYVVGCVWQPQINEYDDDDDDDDGTRWSPMRVTNRHVWLTDMSAVWSTDNACLSASVARFRHEEALQQVPLTVTWTLNFSSIHGRLGKCITVDGVSLSCRVECTASRMRPIATDNPVAWCVIQSVSQSVCLSVCHAAALCKNDWAGKSPVWGEESWELRKHCVTLGRGSDRPTTRGRRKDLMWSNYFGTPVSCVLLQALRCDLVEVRFGLTSLCAGRFE